MPSLRRQLPAYSPLPFAAVRAAARGLFGYSSALRDSVSQRLCDEYGARNVLLVGSGTMALRLALAGVRAAIADRPIALPAYSCYDVASAAEGANARVLLYDLDPSTLGPEEASLRRVLALEPAAVVGAHLYGYPIQVDRLALLARDAGAIFIEDAAQGAGGTFDGLPLGSFGSVSILSFGRGKGRTAGCGGALLSHDDHGDAILASAAAQLEPASQGLHDVLLLATQWALGRPEYYGLPSSLPFLHLGETVYHPPRPPKPMNEPSLRALSVALHADSSELARRRVVAARLAATARRSARVDMIEAIPRAASGYLRLPLCSRIPMSAVETGSMVRHGVARAYPRPLHKLAPFRQRVANIADELPGARLLGDRLFTLPTHRHVAAADLAAIDRWLLDEPNEEPAAVHVAVRTA